MVELYPYQERVVEAQLAGENIILSVPTGGGKTIASVTAFFQNLAFSDGLLPEKALYVVPIRVLTTQFAETCQDFYSNSLDAELFTEIEARYQRLNRPWLSLQTGESPDDPQFESLITACTIDQVIASGIGVPYGLGQKKANINVGAICSSYLILDEPHLYPVAEDGRSYKGAFTTCLELLRLQKGLTRFVFMSATMTRPLLEELSKILNARIIRPDDDELEELNKGRSRIFTCATEFLNSEQILQQHERCSLVVCNTVQRAQKTYLDLAQAIEARGKNIELHLLHSRFADEERLQQGKDLKALLGKEQWQDGIYQNEKSVIVVATQVVEVGLDISVETLHTELAPANSLIQRAGRCARFEKQQGRVIVYRLAPERDNTPASTLPYSAALCKATWEALEQFDGQVMRFQEEQALIDRVHSAEDLDLLKRYEDQRLDLQQDITAGLQTGQIKRVYELIRDVKQVQIVIHNKPAEELKIAPWRWQSFGVYPGALMGENWTRLKDLQAELDLKWLCKRPDSSKSEAQKQNAEEDNRLPTVYEWPDVTNPAQIPESSLLVMPNQLVTYDQKLGLVFLDERLELPPELRQRLITNGYQSPLLPRPSSNSDGAPTQRQHYEQHIGGLADAYHYGIHHDIGYAMRRLEELLGLASGTIDHAIQLAIAAHDLGKLDEGWQRWARAWQRLLHEKENWTNPYQELDSHIFLAKTDYNYRSAEQKKWQSELAIKRPNHACESVMIGRKLILHSLGVTGPGNPNMPLVNAICSAIAHHHTPTAHEYGKTRVNPAAVSAIRRSIQSVCRDGSWSYELEKLSLSFEKGDLLGESDSSGLFTLPDLTRGPERLYEIWLTFLLVRALRLADQRADSYALRGRL